jgi:CheY-like chemotaxis protein
VLDARYVAPVAEAEVGLHGRIVVLGDVTDQREAERMNDEFTALVSHELRTPLTSIIGYLELLRDDTDGDDPAARQRAQFLAVVERNARRLLPLVGDLLFVAQVEAGRLSLDEGDVDVGAIARESAQAAAPRAERGGVELALETQPVPHLRGDRDRLAQALDNLVSNAIKFTPDGGRVTVRLLREGEMAVLEVADTGIGISQADLQRLFERFFRTKRAASAAIPGVGLGLTIAQAIVHGHDGQISVQSGEGDGLLPHRAPAAARRGGRVVSAPLVLLAEDDEDVRALAEFVLRRQGFEVTAVGDGEAALRAAAERPRAVAVLDVSMPLLDGLETARRLREQPGTSAIPIMLLTARVTESDRERGRQAGADTQLDKPFSPAVLAERVRALLDERPTEELDR